MSAALQLPWLWGSGRSESGWIEAGPELVDDGPELGLMMIASEGDQGEVTVPAEPVVSLAFYRKHTESLLRRYLYTSMRVGRTPSMLGDPVVRGGASSRPLRTFEDAVIFVLDMETCLEKIDRIDRELLSRVVLQEYSHEETAALLGMSLRTVSSRLPQALDHLTEKLLQSGILVLSHS